MWRKNTSGEETPTSRLPFTWRSLFHWVPTPPSSTTLREGNGKAPTSRHEVGGTPTPVTRPDPVTLAHTRH